MPEITPIWPDYFTQLYESLGRLVALFANTEILFHSVFRMLTGMTKENARIVCAGMRGRDLTERLTSLMKISSFSEKRKERVIEIRDHFEEIRKLRNYASHRLTAIASDEVAFLDTTSQAEIPNIAKYKIFELQNASNDLSQIYKELVMFQIHFHEMTHEEHLTYAWQYKPHAPPKNPQAPHRDTSN